MNNKQTIELQPKLGGFLIAYIIFSLPGLIISILTIILLFIFIIAAIAGSTGNKSSMDSLTLSSTNDSNADKGILVYDLEGAITSGGKNATNISKRSNIYTDVIKADFAEIKKDSRIKNIVFKVNSPGGEVSASQILGDEIKDLLLSKNIKTGIYYFDGIAASGALWATYKTSNYVYASPYGETGSIGVRLSLPNFGKLADNVGYKEIIIKSSDSKDIGNPLRDPTSSEQAFLQKQVNDIYSEFIGVVANGRKLDINKVKEFANGYVYTNKEARELGLINEISSLDKAVEKASQEVELEKGKYNIWEIENKKSFADEFLSTTSIPQILGISGATKTLDKATFFKSGVAYSIDENRI